MKFNSEDVKELLSDGEVPGLKLIKEGDWISEGKYQTQTCIFECGGKYYRVWDSRSGSAYTSWYYDSDDWGTWIDCEEVKSVEVTVTKWVSI